MDNERVFILAVLFMLYIWFGWLISGILFAEFAFTLEPWALYAGLINLLIWTYVWNKLSEIDEP